MQRQDSFWNYSVQTYRKAGVAEACLSLQERHAIDVNVLLYCCWYGCTRGELDAPAMQRILSFADPWAENVVRPLRAARTWLKSSGCSQAFVPGEPCMALREEIKRAELRAEQLQENRMQELTAEKAHQNIEKTLQMECNLLNIKRYLLKLEVNIGDKSRADLACIVNAAIHGAEPDIVADLLNRILI